MGYREVREANRAGCCSPQPLCSLWFMWKVLLLPQSQQHLNSPKQLVQCCPGSIGFCTWECFLSVLPAGTGKVRLYPQHQCGLAFVCVLYTALIICERNKRIMSTKTLISIQPRVKSPCDWVSHCVLCVLSIWLFLQSCPSDAGVLDASIFHFFSLFSWHIS